jgi:hypothetical protein
MLPMNPSCLSATLDALDETHFWGQHLGDDEKTPIARWIAAQSDVLRLAPGVWRAEADVSDFHLFTGERIRTRQAAGNILGIEACRALAHLAPDDGVIASALGGALQRIGRSCFANGCVKGECAYSAVAYWRYLATSGRAGVADQLREAVPVLSGHRDGRGRWDGFPFYYTLLMLSEAGDYPGMQVEIAYARRACERLLARHLPDGEYGRRQRALLERVVG